MLLFRTLEIPTTPAMAKFLCVQALGPIRLIEITLCLQYRTVHRKALIVSDVRVYTRASSLGTQGIHPEKMRPEFCVFSGLSMSIDECRRLNPGGKKLQDAGPCLLSPTQECR